MELCEITLFLLLSTLSNFGHGKMWTKFAHRPVMMVPSPYGYYYHPNHLNHQPYDGVHNFRARSSLVSPQNPQTSSKTSPDIVSAILDHDPMFNEGMYQGDIIGPLPDEVAPFVMENFIWRNGIINYEISPQLESRRDEIQNAMNEIQSKTCIRFQERNPNTDFDYVHIYVGSGCSSSVGRRGGKQTLSLGKGCYSNGIIVHELMHAIGFYHLHQRHDRDDYLNIHWFNIQPTAINNFKKMAENDLRVDAVFDYDSVMLYGDTTFSKDKVSKTMTPTIEGIHLLPPAAKGGLSEVDVMSINRLYGCSGPRGAINGNYIYG